MREDLAPIEPGSQRARWIVGGVALALLLLGVAMRQSFGQKWPEAASSSLTFSVAGAAGALAGLPFSYRIRAMAIVTLGASMMVLGMGAEGPLGGIGLAGPVGIDLWRLLALSVLPGALLFRARYRAYARARMVLGLALLLSVPFVVSRGMVFGDAGASLVDRAGAAVDAAVILAGCFGFMGADTTAGGSVWAALVLGVLPADIALRGLAGHDQWFVYALTALGTCCAAILAATGQYQLLAAGLARDARRDARRKNAGASIAPA